MQKTTSIPVGILGLTPWLMGCGRQGGVEADTGLCNTAEASMPAHGDQRERWVLHLISSGSEAWGRRQQGWSIPIIFLSSPFLKKIDGKRQYLSLQRSFVVSGHRVHRVWIWIPLTKQKHNNTRTTNTYSKREQNWRDVWNKKVVHVYTPRSHSDYGGTTLHQPIQS